MGNTPSGLPYPEGGDPVANGDDAIKALALKVPWFQAGLASVVLASAATGTIAVVFPTPFLRVPRVMATVRATSNFYAFMSGPPTAAGVTLGVRHFDNVAQSVSVSVEWVAIDVQGSGA